LIVLDAELPELPPSRARVLAAAVREALLNVEKHARAEAVVVTVSCRDDVLTVAVTDDGVGADPAAPWGVGLTTSAEALAQLGGRLTLVSDAPGGTTWRVRLPC
jgi:signal transduction histidine kinase